MALTNLNKLFVRVTNAGLRDAVITKSKEPSNNKIYFLTKTQEIVTRGVAYGLSTDVQAQITKIKSILKAYYDDGTENAVKTAIDAVQSALDAYKADNDAKRALLVKTVAYNAATKAIDFTSENGTTVQSINTSDIIGNHIVQSSSYNEETNHLTLTFAGAESPVEVDIDLSKMLDMNDVISGNAANIASLTAALEQEQQNRESADNAEQAARTAAIKEITDALADPATFWEDYTA